MKFAAVLYAMGAMLSFVAHAEGVIPVQDLVQTDRAGLRPQVVAMRLDSIGLGPTFMGSLSAPAWAWSVFAGIGRTVDLNFLASSENEDEDRDVVKQYELGGQLRWHFGHSAPTGGYLFAELIYLDGEFKRSANETGRTDSHIERGVKPAIGIGFLHRGALFSWDIGIGLRDALEYSAQYVDSGSFESSHSGLFYGALGLRL